MFDGPPTAILENGVYTHGVPTNVVQSFNEWRDAATRWAAEAHRLSLAAEEAIKLLEQEKAFAIASYSSRWRGLKPLRRSMDRAGKADVRRIEAAIRKLRRPSLTH